jgi:hypothetical protein
MKEKPKELLHIMPEKSLGDLLNEIKKAYNRGFKEGREGVIREIEKVLLPMFVDKRHTIFKDDYIIRKKEWESFKHDKKQ